MERDALTKSMRLKHEKDDDEFLPEFFQTQYPCMSARFVEFLKNFDLGEVVFHPVDLYQSDGKTKRPDNYFIMNLRLQKRCWIPEQSHISATSKITGEHWRYRQSHPDWQIAVTTDAAEGADPWFDPRLQACLFLSDRLKRALAESSLRPRFKFHRCAVSG